MKNTREFKIQKKKTLSDTVNLLLLPQLICLPVIHFRVGETEAE